MKSKKALSALLGGIMAVSTAFTGMSVSPVNVVLADDTAAGEYKNPVYNAETDTTEWDYVYFGSYPQSEVTGDQLTDNIKDADYNGNDIAEVDGVKYKRLNAEGATYTYQYGDDKKVPASEGEFYQWESKKAYHYFKFEPIKWRVLQSENGELMLMADKALDDVYNMSMSNHKVNWATSDLRSWLNGYDGSSNAALVNYSTISFISTAFSEDEQNDIQTKEIITEDNNFWGRTVDGMPNTGASTDKLFVLSASEAANEEYGFAPDDMLPSKTRQIKMTDFAFAEGGWAGNEGDLQGNCWWLLRSPGDHERKTALGYRDGRIYKEGYYSNMAPYYCVVPVCYVSADSEYLTTAPAVDPEPSESAKPTASVQPSESAEPTESADPTASVEPSGLQTIEVKLGDVDVNEEIDLQDVQVALKIYLELSPVPNVIVETAADVDQSGEIDLADVQLILQKYLEIVTSFPKGDVVSITVDSSLVPEKVSNEQWIEVRPMNSETDVYQDADEESLTQPADDASGNVWIAGDSIAALHENSTAKQRATVGWGVIFDRYFNGVTVHNTALSSRSSKSYIEEPQYTEIMDGMQAGDYLLISFGHNDEFPTIQRHTNPFGATDEEGSYKWYLKNYYIDPALKKGAIPVLISSVVERNFVDGEFNYQFHSVYRTAMEELVAEYKEQGITIPYIDLHSQMEALYKELGDDDTKNLHAVYQDKDSNGRTLDVIDNTHFTLAGARYAMKYILAGLKQNNLSLYNKFANEEMIGTLDSIATPYTFTIDDASKYSEIDWWITKGADVTVKPADE